MTIITIPDDNTNFEDVILKSDWPGTIETPHCKKHGAMNKVSLFDDGGGYWRCNTADGITCRSGCIQIIKTTE